MRTRTVGTATRSNGSPAVPALALHPPCASSLLSSLDWDALSHSLKLSRRESQIVFLMAADCSEVDIAQELTISAHTVHSYKERIYRKLRVRSPCAVLMKVFETWVSLGTPVHPQSE
jgi:DNA-binding NarL/FixJ family response regulator